MKKIVAIIGSPRGKQSTSYHIVERLYEEIEKLYKELETNIILLSESNIGLCKGCAGCFMGCCTCVQYEDDIKYIENELLSADIVLFVSPVYAHSLTGTMKNFIDRISYWLHILKLTGKYGIVISVSNSNGNMFVDDYLSKMMEFMGISVIERIDYSNVKPLNKQDIMLVAKKIEYYLVNDTIILNYELKNNVFQVYKRVYQDEYNKRINDSNVKLSNEILYWKENRYFECNTYQELYDLINSNTDI